jgi:hypothetical protein
MALPATQPPNCISHLLLLWYIIWYLRSVVICPGCNQAFAAGRHMCVHLYDSPQWRPKNVLLSTSNPFWLIPDKTPFTFYSAA